MGKVAQGDTVSKVGKEHEKQTSLKVVDVFGKAEQAPVLDNLSQTLIGRQLAKVYGDVLSEPIPDHFIKLLEALERKESGHD